MKADTHTIRGKLLRAVFALVFVCLSSLQPALFTPALATTPHVMTEMDAGEHAHPAATADSDAAVDHHGDRTAADKSCEVHCAPAHALPVDCPALALPLRCVPDLPDTMALVDGLAAEFIKPPRI